MVFSPRLLIAIGLALNWVQAASAADPRSLDHFERRVRPVLVERCHKCHAGDKVKGGLRLDSLAAARRGGETGAAIVPAKPNDSLLIQAVRHENGLKMPPDGKLTEAQIVDLIKWVAEGAAWPDAEPTTGPTGAAAVVISPRSPNDGELAAALQLWLKADALTLSDGEPVHVWPDHSGHGRDLSATKGVRTDGVGLPGRFSKTSRILQRPAVRFETTTGLPPTPDEIAAFLADESPPAYETVVNRLLASPQHGERWGRHWLDVVRYAESTANDANAVMRFAWRYRNYVIDALNHDLPYDQFLVEQLAGDLLPPAADLQTRIRQTVATGFLMVGPKALAETDKEQSRLDIVDDQIDVTGRAMLGLTLACARCHDHKFDAIRAVDYYSLAGIFRSTEPFQDEARNSSMWWEFPIPGLPSDQPFMVMAPKEAGPRNLRIHLRGNRFTLGALAPRGFPQILSPQLPDMDPAHSGRLELARWIASPHNPLTARVMVNRLWQHHFGRGLVATSDNFGTRGERPSHPELLDWLAAEFVNSGWSLKAMHRRMVLSNTYQQSTQSRPAARTNDPDNRLLSHYPRRRLSAEELRDAVLAVSGQLDRGQGGSESSDILWKEAEVQDAKRGFGPNRMSADHPFYTDFRKRSIYLPVVRNMLPDVLALFDAADPNGVTAVRNETTVPSQSLFLLNSRFIREQSQHFARRLMADPVATEEQRLGLAHELAYGRLPLPVELTEAKEFLAAYLATQTAQARPDAERRLSAWQSYCQTLLCQNEFLFVE